MIERAQSEPTRRTRLPALPGQQRDRAVDDLRRLEHHEIGQHEDRQGAGDTGRDTAQHARGRRRQAADANERICAWCCLDVLQRVGAVEQAADGAAAAACVLDELGQPGRRAGCPPSRAARRRPRPARRARAAPRGTPAASPATGGGPAAAAPGRPAGSAPRRRSAATTIHVRTWRTSTGPTAGRPSRAPARSSRGCCVRGRGHRHRRGRRPVAEGSASVTGGSMPAADRVMRWSSGRRRRRAGAAGRDPRCRAR